MKRPKTVKIPTLTQIRKHIQQEGWNGREFLSHDSNKEVFAGMCEYASTALSEMLTGDSKTPNWDLRVRGWFKGEITAISKSDPTASFDKTRTKHAHSWVRLPDGRIVDPTFWQFTDAPVRVYIFSADDPRYEVDERA